MPPQKHPPELIRQKAARLLHEHQGLLSLHEFSRLSKIPVSVIQLRLGPWLKFKSQLGYHAGPAHTPESLLEQLHQLVDKRGPDIRLTDFTAETGLNEKVIARAFGTWRNFRTQAGLPPKPEPRIPPEAFLADIFQIRINANHTCSRADYQSKGAADIESLEHCFGSWQAAMKAYATFVENLLKDDPTPTQIRKRITLHQSKLRSDL
jgi:hypothetical protein